METAEFEVRISKRGMRKCEVVRPGWACPPFPIAMYETCGAAFQNGQTRRLKFGVKAEPRRGRAPGARVPISGCSAGPPCRLSPPRPSSLRRAAPLASCPLRASTVSDLDGGDLDAGHAAFLSAVGSIAPWILSPAVTPERSRVPRGDWGAEMRAV
jgi:hypothetical protein